MTTTSSAFRRQALSLPSEHYCEFPQLADAEVIALAERDQAMMRAPED